MFEDHFIINSLRNVPVQDFGKLEYNYEIIANACCLTFQPRCRPVWFHSRKPTGGLF